MKLKLLPICTQNPRTTSFRVRKDDVYKTINSVYFDDSVETTPDSWFTNSAESVSTTSSSDSTLDEPSDVEAVIRGAQRSSNQRLFFEPGESSALVGHVTVAVESEDPHGDFKNSMAEMVESLGVRQGDFEGLKELLGSYLKVNEESNHGYILAAFVDLISGFTVRRSNKNDHSNDKNDDDDNDESLAASFTSAAAVSLPSFASTAVSARY
ncbi:hypothetical protein Cgig2_005480 [Carnegiea gigantea]|uniref:Transcription repressor n=1 Tax=Carnegiea gigantea TaxID=171969 RepID=A0A9Q1KC35_9CARY|nr:hypothetical protein Cgig2_005480 [Carnegiea gigantea]